MLPGASVLGGAACGLSYEGLLRDAMAQEERHRRREMGRSRETPRSQVQAGKADPGHAEQARIAGR
ncbi:hypothetical protein CKO45_23310 [Paracraurococcus ruber]|uniref:Uncharacterized protein n=2 Tax=Paracraurococcus ruber TaxID=77675 RepID=A0ABS1D3F7_9PROT|nr:hypothetical protein [Paracraurococcus ruber]